MNTASAALLVAVVVHSLTCSAALMARSLLRMATTSFPGRMLTTQDLGVGGGRTYQNLGMPRVLPPDGQSETQWMLWLHARDENFAPDVVNLSTGRVLHATSPDGLTGWTLHPDSPVLNPNKENGGDWFFFDSEHVGLGDVIQPGEAAQSKFAVNDGRMFLMYLFGGCSDAVSMEGPGGKVSLKGAKMEIGVAVSQDGAHWSRIEGPEPYGSILVPGKTSDEFDSQFVGWPSVLELGDEYRMYYATYNARLKRFQVGLAVAKDGLMRWTKRGPVFSGSEQEGKFDSNGASRRHITKLPDGTYCMWYEGVSAEGVHAIGSARSNDGVRWERRSDVPVFAASEDPDAWDGGGVGSPHLCWLPEKRRWRMYYCGHARKEAGKMAVSSVGVAESLDEEGLKWQRVAVP